MSRPARLPEQGDILTCTADTQESFFFHVEMMIEVGGCLYVVGETVPDGGEPSEDGELEVYLFGMAL